MWTIRGPLAAGLVLALLVALPATAVDKQSVQGGRVLATGPGTPIGAPTENELAAVAKETGAAMQPPVGTLSVSRSSLPAEPQIAALSTGGGD